MNAKELKVIGHLVCPHLADGWVEFSSLLVTEWEGKLKTLGFTQKQIDSIYINNTEGLRKERAKL